MYRRIELNLCVCVYTMKREGGEDEEKKRTLRVVVCCTVQMYRYDNNTVVHGTIRKYAKLRSYNNHLAGEYFSVIFLFFFS